MSSLLHDLRYSLRLAGRHPGFSAVAVLTLALGIGANSAVFSLVDAVMLRPLGYPEPERLVWLWESNPALRLPVVPVSPADFVDWKEQSRSFEAAAAWRDVNLNLTGVESPERVSGARLFPELLNVLGAKPSLGRGFAPGEGAPAGARVAIITHGLWQRRFGGDPSVVGRGIQLDGANHTIIGVLPPGFQFPYSRTEVLIPWTPSPGDMVERGAKYRFLRVVARLKPGVTLEQVRTEMAAIAHRLEDAYPVSNRGWSVNVMPLRELFISEFRLGLVTLMAAVGLVVLIACVNVANLLLARASGRRREVAVRLALGAGRRRLLGQFLTEGAALGLAGGTTGLLLAWAAIKPLLALIPESNLPIPGLNDVRVDYKVAGFTLGLSLATSVLFGLAPLALTSPDDLHDALREGGRGGTGGARSRKVRAFLVICEIALAVILCIGAGLMMRSFAKLQQVDPGFHAGNALTFRISLSSRYARPAEQRAFYRQLEGRLKTLPSAIEAGLTNNVPLSGSWSVVRFTIDGHPLAPEETPSASNQVVTPGYFRAMGMRLASGRAFTDQDNENAARAAIMNEALARRYWRGANVLGQRIRLDGESPEVPPLVVVGVVRDVHQFGLDEESEPELYRCYYQAPTASMSVVLRTHGAPLALVEATRREVLALDPSQPVYNVETIDRIVGNSLWRTRLIAALFGAFSTLSLVLAAVGVYGLAAYTVSQRTREIGLRLAMGASPGDVLRLVLRRGLTLALAGVLSGSASAYFFARAMAGLLYGIEALDPATFLTAPLLLLAVAAAANLLPALRASRTDPMAALRHE